MAENDTSETAQDPTARAIHRELPGLEEMERRHIAELASVKELAQIQLEFATKQAANEALQHAVLAEVRLVSKHLSADRRPILFMGGVATSGILVIALTMIFFTVRARQHDQLHPVVAVHASQVEASAARVQQQPRFTQ